jgi:hypothetical protein
MQCVVGGEDENCMELEVRMQTDLDVRMQRGVGGEDEN